MSNLEITSEFLKDYSVCNEGYKWWVENCEGLPAFEQLEKIKAHDLDYALWVIPRLLHRIKHSKWIEAATVSCVAANPRAKTKAADYGIELLKKKETDHE